MPPGHLPFAGRAIPLPVFFPSVSSVKMNFRPIEYLEVLVALREPQFLVSAYDVAASPGHDRARIEKALRDATAAGANVLMDSGNYESYWHHDRSWVAPRFWDVLRRNLAPVAFSFDEQSPAAILADATRHSHAALELDRAVSDAVTIAPIVHGRGPGLVDRVRELARLAQPLMIAVAERELGEGIVGRAKTVAQIRAALDEIHPSCVLHVLGTGNPLSILILAIAGANSFDGLEWCQTVADPESARLLHFQQRELVTDLVGGKFSGSGEYAMGTLVHNLRFYGQWMKRVREAIRSAEADKLLARFTSQQVVDQLFSSLKQ